MAIEGHHAVESPADTHPAHSLGRTPDSVTAVFADRIAAFKRSLGSCFLPSVLRLETGIFRRAETEHPGLSINHDAFAASCTRSIPRTS